MRRNRKVSGGITRSSLQSDCATKSKVLYLINLFGLRLGSSHFISTPLKTDHGQTYIT
jgi:hypothetical protein